MKKVQAAPLRLRKIFTGCKHKKMFLQYCSKVKSIWSCYSVTAKKVYKKILQENSVWLQCSSSPVTYFLKQKRIKHTSKLRKKFIIIWKNLTFIWRKFIIMRTENKDDKINSLNFLWKRFVITAFFPIPIQAMIQPNMIFFCVLQSIFSLASS